MLRIAVQEGGDVAVLRCEGQIVLGEELSVLFNTIVFKRDKRLIVLDAAAVRQIDARGLGALVLLKQWLQGAGVKLQLVPSKPIRNLLELTGLRRYFEVAVKRESTAFEFTVEQGQQTENGFAADQ